jgi:lipoic acid synthetase
MITVGQYLPPSPAHAPLARFYSLEEFAALRRTAARYFDAVMAGPRVRSSYHADAMTDRP